MNEKIHLPTSTLAEIKEYLRENYGSGCMCPACNQHVKLYKRKLSSTMAFCLIQFYTYLKKDRRYHVYIKYQNILDELHVKTSQRADWQKLVYFGLIKPETNVKGDARAGYYKLTTDGIDFVNNNKSQPEFCNVYNGKIYGFAKKHITIKDALKNKFNYDELMNK